MAINLLAPKKKPEDVLNAAVQNQTQAPNPNAKVNVTPQDIQNFKQNLNPSSNTLTTDPTHSSVKFNPDRTVDVTIMGVTKHLSNEDYLRTLPSSNMGQTPASQEVVNLNQSADLMRQKMAKNAVLTANDQNALNALNAPQPDQQANISGGVLPSLSELGSAAPNVVAEGIVGAGIGALGGPASVVTVPVGAALGIVHGLISNLKSQAMEETAAQYADYRSSLINIKSIIYDVNHGGDPMDGVMLYNREIAKINMQESNLKALSERDWLTKAKPDLVRIEEFKNGQEQMYHARLIAAINKPDPTYTMDNSDFTDIQNLAS